MLYIRMLSLILFFCVFSLEGLAQWNNWSNVKTVRRMMNKAQNEGKTFFSQFHLWNVRAKNIHSSQYHAKTGEVLYVYSLDFYYASGSYFADEYQAQCRKNIVEVVKKQWRENRAIPSFSWHLENPYVSSEYQYMGCRYRLGDTCVVYPQGHEFVVREILTGKGGERCGYGRYTGAETESWDNPQVWFEDRCREVASLISELKDDKGKPIPIIIRLWHECEDSWMWWGKKYTTPEEYKQLFILTEKLIKLYARGSQILWAYCPDSYWKSVEEFMLRYPGDKYVDFIGFDDYQLADHRKQEDEIEKARMVSKLAKEHGKIAAMFEGSNSIKETADVYFKDYLAPLLNNPEVNFGLVQLWSTCTLTNENQINDRKWFLSQPNILTIK